jgi:methyl-accepting chemotaxis protein
MSDRTEQLASITEEVLSFVTEMDSTIEELRRNATSTADISRQVREDASEGGEAVSATVEGISVAKDSTERTAQVLETLHKNIGQISQILTVIEEITDRTNLLALNAAIIAAQAGEHGAGFTVVADEIRQLADRTRGSTKEIGGIIKTVQTVSREASRSMKDGLVRVNQNVELASNAAESLEKIMASAAQSYEMANRIATSLQEQALASRHLHEVTSRMSDHVSQINRSTTEQASGAKLLAEEAERVREIALQVKNATDQQSIAGRGITQAMEQIASDVMRIRDLLQKQLNESERISEVASTLLSIAQENDTIAQNFTQTMQNLVASGQQFESEVAKFKVGG